MKYKLFISYSDSDKDKVALIKNDLENHPNFEAVIIASNREVGNPLVNKVKKGILESDFIIPMITSNSISQQWINQEIGFATAHNKTIAPIIERGLRNSLKGFIHKELDLPYSFIPKGSLPIRLKEAENDRFMEAFHLLLNDIEQKKLLPNNEGLITIENKSSTETLAKATSEANSLKQRELNAKYKPKLEMMSVHAGNQQGVKLDIKNNGEELTITSVTITDGKLLLGANIFPKIVNTGQGFSIMLNRNYNETRAIHLIDYKLEVLLIDGMNNEYSIPINCIGTDCKIATPIMLHSKK